MSDDPTMSHNPVPDFVDIEVGSGDDSNEVSAASETISITIRHTEAFDPGRLNPETLRLGGAEALNRGEGAAPVSGSSRVIEADDGERTTLVVKFPVEPLTPSGDDELTMYLLGEVEEGHGRRLAVGACTLRMTTE